MEDDTDKIWCKSECCFLKIYKHVVNEPKKYLLDDRKKIRSGVILIDSEDKILISQSYNKSWGVPKGAVEDESLIEAMMRETLEETGIQIDLDKAKSAKLYKINLYNNEFVLFMIKLEHKELECKFTDNNRGVETTGHGWIHIKCLKKLKNDKKFKLNFLTKIITDVCF